MASSAPAAVQEARPSRTARWSTSLLLVFLAAAAHGTSWVFTSAWWCAWIGLATMLLLAVRHTPRQAFVLGMATGFLTNLGGFHWAPQALELCMDAPRWLSFTLFILLAGWESMQFAICCALVAQAARLGVAGLLLAPFAWVTAEFWWPKIFPWMIGYTQTALPPLVQVASVTGSTGIGFFMTILAAIPAAAWLAFQRDFERAMQRPYYLEDKRRQQLAAWQGMVGYTAFAITIFSLMYVWGRREINDWEGNENCFEQLRVALLQVDTSNSECGIRLRDRTLAVQEKVDLVCWPESAIGTYSSQLEHFHDQDRTMTMSRDSLAQLRPTEKCTVEVLAGGRTYDQGASDEGPYFMSAFLIQPQETIRGRYHKRTLLPFGEYMPGQHYFPDLRHWATLNEITLPGTSAHCLETTRDAKLGVVICYEDILPANAREVIHNGAEVLISLINDSRFENPLTLEQHRRLAVLRAVENRRYLLRCSATGVTCAVSPTGRLLGELPVHSDGELVQTIARVKGETLYTQYGDWFPYGCTVVSVIAMLLLRRGRADNNSEPPPATL